MNILIIHKTQITELVKKKNLKINTSQMNTKRNLKIKEMFLKHYCLLCSFYYSYKFPQNMQKSRLSWKCTNFRKCVPYFLKGLLFGLIFDVYTAPDVGINP